MEFLQLTNLKKVYNPETNPYTALNGVNLSIRRGEFVMIVGPSGSGKSSLLHLIGGVDQPTSGRVFLNGEDVFAQSPKQLADYRRRKVNIVYQNYNLISMLTVKENIVFPAMVGGKQVEEARLLELAQRLDIAAILQKFPHQLSGGQQQRVSVARAMYTQPEVLLADEPTGNLDRANTREVMELLKQVNQHSGQTIVMITHDRELTRFASRVITIQDGAIVQDEVQP